MGLKAGISDTNVGSLPPMGWAMLGVSASTYGCPAPPIGTVANPGNVYAMSSCIRSCPVVAGSYPVAAGSYLVTAGTVGLCTCDAKADPPTDRTGYSGVTGSYTAIDGGCMAAVVGAS